MVPLDLMPLVMPRRWKNILPMVALEILQALLQRHFRYELNYTHGYKLCIKFCREISGSTAGSMLNFA